MPSYAYLETLFAIKQAIANRGPVAASIDAAWGGSTEAFVILSFDDGTQTFRTTSVYPSRQRIPYSVLAKMLSKGKIECSIRTD